MKPIITVALLVMTATLISCAQRTQPAEERALGIEGTVTQISSGHGNVYTTIRPEQYETLGLEAGRTLQVSFGDSPMTLVIGRDYTDVPTGTPLAVLHREGLTFAIRDGNFSRTYGIGVGDRFRIMNLSPRE